MGKGDDRRFLNDTKVQVFLLCARDMLWDLITGLSLVTGFALMFVAFKEISQLRKELEDLKSMVRVIRYNALESHKKGD